jgi:hypothetical protein
VPGIGLTSPANVAFTEGLGCYDEVIAYADVTRLSPEVAAVYVDMSRRRHVARDGSRSLARPARLQPARWVEPTGRAWAAARGWPGRVRILFFAPAQGKKRVADWGPQGFQDRLTAAWTAFLARARDPARPWLQVVAGQGREAIESTYSALLDGKVPANEGRILAV